MEYTHARDYLLELAEGKNTAGWLHDLIIRVVNTNGVLTDDDLKATVEQLKANGASTLTYDGQGEREEEKPEQIALTELIHHSGVNALANEQKIRFSPDITLLFGMNSTGKSSGNARRLTAS